MCGLLAFIGAPGALSDRAWADAQREQAHRGPDDRDAGVWNYHGVEIRLAHQRLAIQDLSPAGRQPIGRLDGPGVLVFNGEIYNFLELRAELEAAGRIFASASDSEVLLLALETWGPDATVAKLNGMWAFAWLEPGRPRIWLSRDRAGEKPLYWYRDRRGLFLASEVKALLTLAGRRFPLDAGSVRAFVGQSILDTGRGSFFSGIEQLPAASLACVDLGSVDLIPSIRSYWRPTTRHPDEAGLARQVPEAIIEQVRETFVDAVRIRRRSDVPVGILLSGGLDSSAIAAAAHLAGGTAGGLNLLSAVSKDARFDESPYIERVAAHLGCGVVRVSMDADVLGQNLFSAIEDACWHNDAPIGSLSNLAHRQLMRRAKEHGITVVLSGQGADELLCGYKKYLGFHLQWLLRQGRLVDAAADLLEFWRNGTVLTQFRLAEAKRYLPGFVRRGLPNMLGPRLRELAPIPVGLPRGADVRERQALDLTTLSIPTLTHFEDRMSMAESREVRLPFLDPRLIDLFLAAPTAWKLHNGWTKHLLRKAVEPWLPAEIVWRRDKQGFINPEAEWLKHDLQEQVSGYFAPDSLIFRLGLVDRDALLRIYAAYARQSPGRGRVWFRDIFNPLALEIWLRRFEGHVCLD
jgi:asparagine synthase (glutamine-hydrolysing)